MKFIGKTRFEEAVLKEEEKHNIKRVQVWPAVSEVHVSFNTK